MRRKIHWRRVPCPVCGDRITNNALGKAAHIRHCKGRNPPPPPPKTLAQLKCDKRVEIVDDERSAGNGVIMTLRRGWSFDALQDNRVAGADTIRDALALLQTARPFAGPYTE